MHKYLSSGAASWVASTRTIAGATMSSPFASSDQAYKRQVFFRIGTSLYYGVVDAYVSPTSITLLKSGSLPAVDGAIAEILLFEYPAVRTYQSYVDRISSMLKDDSGKVKLTDGSDMDLLIGHAVAIYSKDAPMTIRKKVQGNGTAIYPLAAMLGSLYTPNYSGIEEIEYPIDQSPPAYIDSDDGFEIYDDGTAQDGSNLALRLADSIATTEYFIVQFTAQRSLPKVGVQNFPDTDQHFAAITILAAAHGCMILAAAYAQSNDKSMSVDVVNFEEKTRKYRDLARDYMKEYTRLVFGSDSGESSIAGAVVDKDVDLMAMDGSRFLFHGGKGR